MDQKHARIYYSPRGYWKGITAIQKLAAAARVSEAKARDFLKKQAIWQIYLAALRHIPRPKFHVSVPNEVHQAVVETRLISKRPVDAIKAQYVTQKTYLVVPGRSVGLKEQKLPFSARVCYLYQVGELECGRRRATDPVWSLEVCRIGRSVTSLTNPRSARSSWQSLQTLNYPPDGVLKR